MRFSLAAALTFALGVSAFSVPAQLQRRRNMPRDCTLPDLYDATLKELSNGMESGCFTAVDLVKAYLARISEVNEELHAVIETNPDALTIAA